MSTTITNNITIVDNEGDTTDVLQITISSVTINQTSFDPVSVTYSPNNILITRKTTDPVIITASV